MKHGSTVLFIGAAAVCAAVGVLLLAVHPTDGGRRSSGAPMRSAPEQSPPPSASAAPQSAPPARPPDFGEEPDAAPSVKAPSDASIQKGLEATWPGDLPAEREKGLVDLGWAVARADLTGRGRDRWPAYFPGDPPRALYTRVRLRAAVARNMPARAGLVQVIMIWTGTDPQGLHISQRQTGVCLGWDGTGWLPRVPSACAAS